MYNFFAYISRMKYITRWALMRNSVTENIQEHSHMAAVLAHALGTIRRDVLGGDCDPDRCAAAALFHDATELFTGDMPTPVKYFNPAIREAYRQVEDMAAGKLLDTLPPELRDAYEPLLREEDPEIRRLVKAADKLSAANHKHRYGGIYAVVQNRKHVHIVVFRKCGYLLTDKFIERVQAVFEIQCAFKIFPCRRVVHFLFNDFFYLFVVSL